MRFSTALLFLLVSCAGRESEPDHSAVVEKVTGADSMISTADASDSMIIDASLAGFYQSALPCKGCDGARQTLLLRNDGLFAIEDFNRNPSDTLIRSTGHWSLNNENIVLFSEKLVIGKFRPVNDSLLTMERQGTIMSDSSSRRFALVKKENGGESATWKKKAEAGATAYFIGTEPFWSLEITAKNEILFTQASPSKKHVFNDIKQVDSPGTRFYSGANNTDSIQVSIREGFCSDGMSDRLYSHQITVLFNRKDFRGCGTIRD